MEIKLRSGWYLLKQDGTGKLLFVAPDGVIYDPVGPIIFKRRASGPDFSRYPEMVEIKSILAADERETYQAYLN